MKVSPDDGNCPTCGQRVGTFTTDEGTSYFLGRAEQDASELELVREQLEAVKIWLASPQTPSQRLEGIRQAMSDPEYAAQIVATTGL